MKKPVFYVYYTCTIFVSLILSAISPVAAQRTNVSTDSAKDFRNSIKLNITSQIFYNNAIQFSYERMMGRNQSLDVFGGYNEFPFGSGINIENASITNTNKKSGYSIGADYRFYLSKENKYKAPHGVYLAPFFSYYQFTGNRTLSYSDSGVIESSNLNTKISFINIGGEAGYQFILWKRCVIDAVIFGPAGARYNLQAKLQGHINGLDENETLQAVIQAMKDKFPLLNQLSEDKEVSANGSQKFWSAGFRYSISVGFRF